MKSNIIETERIETAQKYKKYSPAKYALLLYLAVSIVSFYMRQIILNNLNLALYVSIIQIVII